MLFQNKFYEQRLLSSAFKQITKSVSYVVEKAEQLYVPTLLTVRNRSKRKYLALDSMAVRVTQAWTCRTAHWPTTPLAACCTGGLQTAQTHWRRLHELRTYHCWGFFVQHLSCQDITLCRKVSPQLLACPYLYIIPFFNLDCKLCI